MRCAGYPRRRTRRDGRRRESPRGKYDALYPIFQNGSRRELNMKNRKLDTRTLTGVAIFTAIVIVLQFLGSFIRFGPFSISLVLIPIVVGAALYGTASGAWLGFVFGLIVLLSGDSAAFLTINPLGTILTVLVKGTLAGLCAGLVYKLLERANTYVAAIAAAVAAPVVNTGVFLIGCRLFFMETISGWAEAAGFPSVGNYMILGLAGGNFLFEVLVDLILSPVILRLIRIGKKQKEN